MNTFCT